VLLFWDSLFAEDPALDIVDLVCVAMLLRIRWEREFILTASNSDVKDAETVDYSSRSRLFNCSDITLTIPPTISIAVRFR